ncbi:hypothetical protein BDD12DRAFT_112038 [Trichophaea hybrida]|nr:hypothetical protein BDD12DRAFT_112038 [Trichophaea hybrida]
MPNPFYRILVVLAIALSLSTATPIIIGNASQIIISTTSIKHSKTIWEILQFIGINYVAHAFTINIAAGYGWIYASIFSLMSLFFPSVGLVSACRSLEQIPTATKCPLERAARAGALCMVVRTKHWEPRDGDKVWCWQKNDNGKAKPRRLHYEGLELEYLSQKHIQIHGLCQLPKSNDEDDKNEYMMAKVPPDFKVKWANATVGKSNKKETGGCGPKAGQEKAASTTNRGGISVEASASDKNMETHMQEISGAQENPGSTASTSPPNNNTPLYMCEISSLYSIPKTILALIQLFSAVPVVWEARNNTTRGYAAYQLTLIPYALMSLINIFSSFVTPKYPAVYMINSTTMQEARSRGGKFEGTVGELWELEEKDDKPLHHHLGEDINLTYQDCAKMELKAWEKPSPVKIILETVICLFTDVIQEHIRKEIFIVRFLWRKPGDMIYWNIRRSFKKDNDQHLIMVSPFGNPKFREYTRVDYVMTIVAELLLIVSLAVPYIVMGIFTHYRSGTSRWYERAIFMAWLALGQFLYVPQRMHWRYLQAGVAPLGSKWLNGVIAYLIIVVAVYASAAAGGFVVVGSMLWNDKMHPANSGAAQ